MKILFALLFTLFIFGVNSQDCTDIGRINPWMNIYDEWPEAVSHAPTTPTTQKYSTGVDKWMQIVRTLSSPVNGASRDYLPINQFKWDVTTKAILHKTTADYLNSRRVLICFWFEDGDDRYDPAAHRAVINGLRDQSIIDAVQSLPIGNNRPASGELWSFYFAWQHEPDIYLPQKGVETAENKQLYVKAVQHAMKLAIDTAIGMNALPYEFGTGGLLAKTGLIDAVNMSGYNWMYNMPQYYVNSGMIVWFFDTYFKVHEDSAGTLAPNGKKYKCDSFASRVPPYAQKVRTKFPGITRIVLAETACALNTDTSAEFKIAANSTLIPWLQEVADWLETEGEGVSFFSKPTGVASRLGEITGSALEEAAVLHKDFNRCRRRNVEL